MKVNVEVDCTPAEARAFLGLPDVQPMQKAMMDQLQDKMASSINAFSPEGLMQSWFNPNVSVQVMEMFQNMINQTLAATGGGKK
ncbi:MAG: hypothetical protein A4S14_11680 [Proteobacteria bacterium SG_bin9]|nr:MAG: hypothetical protein A4S14_11680 [Proteobacteria bacterium SG_bin9]